MGKFLGSARGIALCLFLGLTGCYLSLSPANASSSGYIAEEMESGLRMMSIVTAVSKGRPVPPMVWSRHGPIPVLFDIPFLKIGKRFLTPDLALSFQPILYTAALLTLVFLWLRKISSPAVSIFVTLAGAFGTMLWPYAYIGLETKQSFFVLLAGYLGLARGPIRGWLRVLGFAVICGLALTLKSVSVVLWPAIAYLLYVQFRDDWRARWGQLFASCLVVVGFCAGNVVLRNFYWSPLGGAQASVQSWMIENKFQLFTNVLGLLGSPSKGLFLFAPILIAALWAIPRAFGSRREVAIFATLVAACALAFVSIFITPYDETWGPRFLHVVIAPLLVCIGAAWPVLRWRVYAPIALLAIAGIVVSFLGSFFWYGVRGVISEKVRQNTMEWLTSDNVWNEVLFSTRLFGIWWQGGSDPVIWKPSHIWVWEPHADVPPWKSIDLRPYAEPQAHILRFHTAPREPFAEGLARFYWCCLAGGSLLLLRTIRISATAQEREVTTGSRRVAALATAGFVVASGVWILTPTLPERGSVQDSGTAGGVQAQPDPVMVLDNAEVVAGKGSYTLSIAALANEAVAVRYSLNGAELEEMRMKLDERGAIHFEVPDHTRKGVYRFQSFRRLDDGDWVNSSAVLTVK